MVSRLGHARAVRRLAFLPDGQRLLSASDDGELWCWDAQRGEPVGWAALDRPAQAEPRCFLAVSADGKRVALMDGSGELAVWAPNRDFAEVCRFSDRPGSPSGLALSADGGLIARACVGRIDILDVARAALLHRLPGHEGPETLLQFMPPPVARRLVVVGEGRLIVWQARDGRRLTELPLPPGPFGLRVTRTQKGFRLIVTADVLLTSPGEPIPVTVDCHQAPADLLAQSPEAHGVG